MSLIVGRFKRTYRPKFVERPMLTHLVGREDPVNLASVFYEPRPTQPFTNVFFLFVSFAISFFLRILGDIWVLRDPKLPAKKKKNRQRLGREHACQISGSISKKKREHQDFLCGKHVQFFFA